MFRRTRFPGDHRPRAVWFALGTGLLFSLGTVGGVLLPVLGLIGAAAGAVAVVRIPFGTITLVVVAGYALAAGILASIFAVRWGWLAWVLAVAAVIATFIVSLYPAFAAVAAGMTSVQDAIPWVGHLVHLFIR